MRFGAVYTSELELIGGAHVSSGAGGAFSMKKR
jgi:hypothetical protein